MDITMDGVSDMISFLGLGEDGLREARKAIVDRMNGDTRYA